MMAQDQMTAAEAERRLDSIYLLGGTSEERRYAVKRWKQALVREAKIQQSEDKRKTAKAVR